MVDDARVTFRGLSEDLVRWYADTGEWRDRAGGYAIQGAGAALVERDRGRLHHRRRPARGRAGARCSEDVGLAPWSRRATSN